MIRLITRPYGTLPGRYSLGSRTHTLVVYNIYSMQRYQGVDSPGSRYEVLRMVAASPACVGQHRVRCHFPYLQPQEQ